MQKFPEDIRGLQVACRSTLSTYEATKASDVPTLHWNRASGPRPTRWLLECFFGYLCR